MKVKELIKLLNEADPTGEEIVCVGSKDIHFVENLPAYYDGSAQQLIHDESKRPFYSIIGGKYYRKGRKVKIHTLSFEGCIWNDVNFPIDYSELGESSLEYYQKMNDKIREESKRDLDELEKEFKTKDIK